ncbi:MAG: flagellar basal body P-ring protein FlgI [Candidatus Electryonea clarkiae]|nr:flagellar basal body P-ring protein FlgI [Candidatus Electryonea clarkiae]MDP8285181.1 flagellar basal body P-ring protein FlgI [Candidatus Electryonea clarkiae]
MKNMKRLSILILVVLIPLLGMAQPRIKDLASVEGINDIPLIGYGVIVGLDGTGDTPRSLFTNQALMNMLDRFGISVENDKVRIKNVAGVIVTATLPAFAKPGQKIDVVVSSIGDARSLLNGTLLLSPLVAPDELVYGVAQGPVSIGGFSVETEGVSLKHNANMVGRIPGGLTVEQDAGLSFDDLEYVSYSLHEGDVTTAIRVADAINEALGIQLAAAVDPVSIQLQVPANFPGGAMGLLAATESITVTPDVEAKVIVNERTGTVVIGSAVQLSSVAISHGALTISIVNTPMISQPGPFSQGTTTVAQTGQIEVQQQGEGVVVIEESTSVGDVATALNSLGVSPRDIIAIFQALKQAGALHADLVII